MSFIRTGIIGSALAAAALTFATPALAHPKLVASNPAANALVAKPSKLELRFSEKLVGQFSSVDLIMTGMPGMANHGPMKVNGVTTSVAGDGKTLVVKLRQPLAAGTYRLDWHAVSADTHRVNGSYSFKVK
jgi:methionine-rich copper-binding protein CopC